MNLPLSLIAMHYLADWKCQSDWMALNKSKWNQSLEGFKALIYHVGLYSTLLAMFYSIMGAANEWAYKFWLITFILHWVVDAITSKLTGKFWFFKQVPSIDGTGFTDYWMPGGGNRHYFFNVIGIDQLIHYGCLAWTLKFLS